MGSLTRAEYEEILSIADRKIEDAKINFFRQVSFMSQLSKLQMVKLLPFLTLREVKRNSIICRQGDPATLVFIVNSGEFTITKRQELHKKEERDSSSEQKRNILKSFLSSDITVDASAVKTRRFKLTNDGKLQVNCDLNLSLLGPGRIFGDDNVLADEPYMATMRCHSSHGSVFSLASEAFLRLIKKQNAY